MPARPVFLNDTYEHPVEERFEVRMDRFPPAPRCRGTKKDGTRCKRFASRNTNWCRLHLRGTKHFKLRRKEVPDMVLAQEVARDARALAKEVHARLHEYAPDALRTIKELADDRDVSPAVRLKASEILLRHSGLSLERSGDVNLTVNVNAPAASDLIRERLDRLAATSSVIAGELDHAP